MNALAELRSRFAAALAGLLGDAPSADTESLAALVLPSQDPKFGDYQANCAMPLGKRLGKPPRDVAAELVDRLTTADGFDAMCEPPEVAGPGFINLRLRDNWIARQLAAASADADRLGVASVERP
ncbi:MAG: arginine--tRNA ligase, partial [Planctomycetota bacterium]